MADKLNGNRVDMKPNTVGHKPKEKGWEFLALSVFSAIIGVALLACPTYSIVTSDPFPPFALWFQRAMCLVQAVICGLVYHFSRKLRTNISYSWHCKCCILIAVIVTIGDFISIIIINFVYVGILVGTKQDSLKDDGGLEYLVLVLVALSFAANILTVYECRVLGSWIKEQSKDVNKQVENNNNTVNVDKTGSSEVQSRVHAPCIQELETQNSFFDRKLYFYKFNN